MFTIDNKADKKYPNKPPRFKSIDKSDHVTPIHNGVEQSSRNHHTYDHPRNQPNRTNHTKTTDHRDPTKTTNNSLFFFSFFFSVFPLLFPLLHKPHKILGCTSAQLNWIVRYTLNKKAKYAQNSIRNKLTENSTQKKLTSFDMFTIDNKADKKYPNKPPRFKSIDTKRSCYAQTQRGRAKFTKSSYLRPPPESTKQNEPYEDNRPPKLQTTPFFFYFPYCFLCFINPTRYCVVRRPS
jgi:hypothetical protein